MHLGKPATMPETGQKNRTASRVTPGGAGSAVEDRRVADRHAFTASAEVIDLSSGARFSTRTTDLGPGGCFVDTLVPLPIGSRVRVTVHKGKTQLESDGSVVYSQTGLGMGIEFDALAATQRIALERWLHELTGGRVVPVKESGPAPASEPLVGNSRHAALVRLVQLMVSKGILTEAEAASVLFDPLL